MNPLQWVSDLSSYHLNWNTPEEMTLKWCNSRSLNGNGKLQLETDVTEVFFCMIWSWLHSSVLHRLSSAYLMFHEVHHKPPLFESLEEHTLLVQVTVKCLLFWFTSAGCVYSSLLCNSIHGYSLQPNFLLQQVLKGRAWRGNVLWGCEQKIPYQRLKFIEKASWSQLSMVKPRDQVHFSSPAERKQFLDWFLFTKLPI